MTDRQMMDDFLRFLEDHNYCKRVYCENCQRWKPKKKSSGNIGRCHYWEASTWSTDWCSEALERVNDESISIG